MERVLDAIKATYNFFSGDAVLLSSAIIAFALGYVLANVAHAPNPLVAVVFVALIVGGLTVTLGREIAGRVRRL